MVRRCALTHRYRGVTLGRLHVTACDHRQGWRSPGLGFIVSDALTRRDLLRRGAVVGGAVWVAPALETFSRPAFAAVGSPVGKGLSYVVVCWTCDLGLSHCAAKLELDAFLANDPAAWETGSFETPGCEGLVDCAETADALGCSDPRDIFDVTIETNADGDPARVTLTLLQDGCTLLEGSGVGKCGSDTEQSGGECVAGETSGGLTSTNSITFELCGD